MGSVRLWTREEILIAINVYCKIPFKDSNVRHPLVKETAKLLNRTPAAVNKKIGNLGSLDPHLRAQGISGLGHKSKLDEVVWNEFQADRDRLIYESERLIAERKNKPIEETSGISLDGLPEGAEREAVVKQRVGQAFFRNAVLSSYNEQCCISGVNNTRLLEACHIVGWADDAANRTNPNNGLCMNPFFHKAYDNMLLAISPDYIISVSEQLISDTKEERFKLYLSQLNGRQMTLPERFLPEKDLLDRHFSQYAATI